VTVVDTGKQAVAAAVEQPFDAVLMDVQMPEMDGFEATAAIRQAERTTGRHVSIIAMTAHAMKGDRERCLEAGMDGYVSKPLQADALYAAVERRYEPTQPESESLRPPPTPDQPPPLDLAALREHFGDDALLKDVAAVFVESCPGWQVDIRTAVDARDAARLRTAAHTIKGAVSHFGAQQAYDAAHELEQMGKSGQLDHASAACDTLNHQLDRLRAALQAML
jgi:CheY-like chemotaxis protein